MEEWPAGIMHGATWDDRVQSAEEDSIIMDALSNGDQPSDTSDAEVTEDLTLSEASEVKDEGQDAEEAKDSGIVDQEPALDLGELKAAFEALLFVSHEPLSLEKLALVLEGVPKSSVKSAMQDLQAEYETSGRGLQILEVAGGYVMVTRPEQSLYIKRLTSKSKPAAKVSRSALEALAIVSYKQPITRADIEKIRGVETSGVLRTLLDQKLIRIVGRQDIPGRPILYGTGKQFLQRFGLRDLRDLPPLKELKELGSPEQFPMELPFAPEEQEGEARVSDLSA
ncbi:SMC-Scp complex subunit ScpB [Candidatus Nitrospira neomarina]|uniref:SMC-Scp complex subunit ScpB n=1 Tax=Candidatus Nitrospira neomarina TaxID=3020899 RepID=A0AA96K0W5_9BACT|nr:SMC-Scp complex subunit ScpB [Candidatus Nitrospira neomarina]WNM62476.1 SMC-Scp complex subunit ScpB [Candidatus Nitrospira neomarina]